MSFESTGGRRNKRHCRFQNYARLSVPIDRTYPIGRLSIKFDLRHKAYFFSVGPNGEVLPLTIANLKKAFPDSHRFHDNLDMAFRNDSQLAKYDDFHKMFKVNRLLIASE